MNKHEKIDYIELPSRNLNKTKQFFSKVFGWSFKDFGDEYIAFENEGINGGFYKSNLVSLASGGATLAVFYSEDIHKTQDKIKKANGIISTDIFTFPGGCRFHFIEPSGNEFAVWSDKE